MSYSIAPDRTEHTVYAGFWWRALAFILDWIVLTVIDGIVAFAAGMEAWMHDAFAMRPTIGLYTFVIGLLYFPLLESSRLRATLGKLACGLVVVDEDGRQLSFSRAFGRTLGKAVSGAILMIGFMMAGWTHRKQALHDMMAGCLVLKKTSPSISVRLPETG